MIYIQLHAVAREEMLHASTFKRSSTCCVPVQHLKEKGKKRHKYGSPYFSLKKEKEEEEENAAQLF
jgi:hypothetical protein